MIYGRKAKIDFESLKSPNFVPHVKNIKGGVKNCCLHEKWENCVSASIELISGVPATQTDKYIKDLSKGFYTRPMINYLRKLGFTAIELTINNLTKHPKEVNWHYHLPLTDQHVLIVGAQLDTRDSSSFVIFGGNLYHHCHLEPNYGPLYFLNKPILDLVLVYHQSWGEKQVESFN